MPYFLRLYLIPLAGLCDALLSLSSALISVFPVAGVFVFQYLEQPIVKHYNAIAKMEDLN